jgi:hypothetical protein
MSGVFFKLPASIVGAALIVDQLKPMLENLDAPVSSRATPQDLDEADREPVYGGKLR